MKMYSHVPHPHIERRKKQGPVKTIAERTGINGKIGLVITTVVGTMVCAYVFGAIALVALPAAIASHNLTLIIAWVSSNFIQLVLLPVILVGTNLLAKTSDKRADQTFADAEAILHECIEVQKHLAAQDEVLMKLSKRLGTGQEGKHAIRS